MAGVSAAASAAEVDLVQARREVLRAVCAAAAGVFDVVEVAEEKLRLVCHAYADVAQRVPGGSVTTPVIVLP